MPRRFLFAMMISVGLSLLLSVLPVFTKKGPITDVPTFQEIPKLTVSSHNLVDLFTLLETHYKISHVEWDQPAIMLMLTLPEDHKKVNDLMFHDAYSIVYVLMNKTTNVKHVTLQFARPNEPNTKGSALLLIEVDRTQIGQEDKWKSPTELFDVKQYVKQHFFVKEAT
ncbi:hypothetical protein [Brevibacillus laterosporus]|uniref:hypothetical protein n=1 Tax=Brevibacillus laterosporus TaxID=1465 RepID=UPI000CE54846|nr:hypothetical protein [Brevibacillus laterosporus]MED1666313.1 hypothetical protein [Brevibacillus laterosporus]MED1670636.1 hypothetical protein [Brevibacillus laterosporus]MED1716657.1 hypothetical protein [Brevibacillus laterosporus]PPA89443.1 hypothetical protein C4A76_03960 [Brevibacillus laterosporus]